MENLSLLKNKKILIVAAHPDDEILGCGGTIIKYKKFSEIEVMFMTDGVSSRGKDKLKALKRKEESLKLFKFLKLKKPTFLNFPDNKMDSIPMLKIVKQIEKKIKNFKPNVIITHFSHCLNIDHKKTFEAVMTASRPIKNTNIKTILSFEILSSTEWSQNFKDNFNPNFFIDISNLITKKINALKFYKSEIKKFPHSRSFKGVESLAKLRGISCGCKNAEAFYLVRHIED